MKQIIKFVLLFRLLFIRPTWFWSYIWYSSKNPFYLNKHNIDRMMEYKNYSLDFVDILKKITTSTHDEIQKVVEEFKEIEINTGLKTFLIPSYCDASNELRCLCYCLIRLIKPLHVVETGVARGVTSFYLLLAMQKNGTGSLYSIDLPLLKLDAKKEIGILVPSELRSRWTLIYGPGPLEMKKLRKKTNPIDLFIHDSSHNYLNQLMEYDIALNWLKKGGVLVSDDVENNALIEVKEKNGVELSILNQAKSSYLGVIQR